MLKNKIWKIVFVKKTRPLEPSTDNIIGNQLTTIRNKSDKIFKIADNFNLDSNASILTRKR